MFRLARRFLCRKNGGKTTRFSSTTSQTVSTTAAPVTPASAVEKEPKLQQWKRFWTVLFSDYKEVVIDTASGMKSRPRKAIAYLTGIGCVLYAMETNPEDRTYYTALLQSTDEAILVSEANLNPKTDKRLSFIHQCYNEGTIRCLSLGLFSLIWIGNYHKDCGIYPSQCSYLEPGILNFHQRIVDIGFLGQWWNIRKYMKDHDVNPREFDDH